MMMNGFRHHISNSGVKFTVRWVAGDTTWEPYLNVDELEALDQYFALQGVRDVAELLPTARPQQQHSVAVPVHPQQ